MCEFDNFTKFMHAINIDNNISVLANVLEHSPRIKPKKLRPRKIYTKKYRKPRITRKPSRLNLYIATGGDRNWRNENEILIKFLKVQEGYVISRFQ